MDETVILWSINGKEIHTFRRHTASIKAVAFLYDGPQKYALTADGNGNVHQWTLSGEHLRRFDHSPGYRHGANWVSKVAFSPDGKNFCVEARNYLQCTSVLSPGEDLTPPNQEPPPFVEGAPHQVSSKNFTLDYAGSTAFLIGLDGKKIRSYRGHSAAVVSAAFSTADAGRQILTGSADGTVRRWDLEIGGMISCFEGEEQLPVTAAFTPDGKAVLTAGPEGPVKRWDLNGALIQIGEEESIPVLSPDGQYALTGGLGVKMWQREAPQRPVRVFREDADPFDFGTGPGQALAVAFSPDGKSVLATDREAIIRWDVQTGAEIDRFRGHHEQVNSMAVAPTARGGIYVLSGSNDNTAKLWDSADNVVKQEEMSARPMEDPIGSEFIGGEIQTYRGHANDVTTVAFSPATPGDPSGGKFVLTGSRDNTAKIWERDSGKEIATLIALDSADWVVTTPSGLFDASPGAMNLMHFVVGVEAIDLEQLKERYFEPGLLAKLMGFSQDPLRSVEGFGNLPLYPEMEARLSEDGRKLQVSLTPRSGGIGKLSLFINDKEVLEDANSERAESVAIDLTKFPRDYLPGAANQLALRAYNADGWLKSAPLELDYDPPAAARGSSSGTGSISNPFTAKRPSLYAIVVGTADYAGDKLDLTFADLDAAYFSQALRAAAPKVYEERVEVVLLNTDAKSTDRQGISDKASIGKAFTDIAEKAKSQDVLVIYFSGHGLNYGAAENSQFYYLTKDIAGENLSDPEIRNNYAISSAELTEWIKKIPARKQVMVIDACNSGKIVEDFTVSSRDLNSAQIRALDRMKDRTGMFILTGSAADKVSYEAGQYGQGLLTFSLLQGMSGLALTPDKRVDVMTLFQHARDEVPGLARGINGIQTPMLAFPSRAGPASTSASWTQA
jgi:WD40 repeat protein